MLVELEGAVVPVADDRGLLDLLQPAVHDINNLRKGSTSVSKEGQALTFCLLALD